jgi:hypothetical protein
VLFLIVPPAARGFTFLLYTKEGVNYRHAALFSYTGKYGVQRRGVGGRPRSCRHNVSCTRQCGLEGRGVVVDRGVFRRARGSR